VVIPNEKKTGGREEGRGGGKGGGGEGEERERVVPNTQGNLHHQ